MVTLRKNLTKSFADIDLPGFLLYDRELLVNIRI